MSSTFFGATGGGGGASSVLFFGMAYGPTLSVGPPASAGTSCLGLPLSGVWEGACAGDWVEGVWLVWSCARTGKAAQNRASKATKLSLRPIGFLNGKVLLL